MSDASTKHLIDLYMEEAAAPMFLSGFFQSPARNFHTSQKVEIDVMRDDEDVAVAIQDLSVGPRPNETSLYTSKEFKPPIFDESGEITAYSTISRQAGVDPFQDPDFGANATLQAFRIFRKLEAKIRRAIEMMASQVLQTGQLTLKDKTGANIFLLDFQPKTEHFPTAGVTWAENGGAGNPLGDLEALATVVRRNGKKQPKKLIFGASAMRRFLANPGVVTRIEKLGIGLGALAPESRGEGATFVGYIWIGHYRLEMWMYDGYYRAPGDGVFTPYVGDDHVIMMTDGRLDLTYGSIPTFVKPESRVLSFLPPRITSEEKGLALTTNSWLTPDGKSLMVEAGTRPLTIPTAIDSFGCLDVTA
jgi:hypothetical protein